MTEVIIRNKELLDTLDSFVDSFYKIDGYDDHSHHVFDPADAKSRGQFYTSDEYLKKVWENYNAHTGYPTEHFAQPVGRMADKDPDKWFDISFLVRKKFPAILGTHSSALFNYYPPGGFVGWHTNWNANAYQILFTWSKTGDGYFKYYDNQTKEIVTIQDVPGWQCRWYYFGLQKEEDHHCWHAAYAGCDRFTLAYKFFNSFNGKEDVIKDRQAQTLRDLCIEDIENE